jgi:hypothetical protein
LNIKSDETKNTNEIEDNPDIKKENNQEAVKRENILTDHLKEIIDDLN